MEHYTRSTLNYFTPRALDRAADKRADGAWLEEALQDARFIPVYDAALYIDQNAGSADPLDPAVAKRLDIVYRTSIKASDMITAAERTLTRQHPEASIARWRGVRSAER